MKAVILEKQTEIENKPLKLTEVDTPQPKGNEVLLKVLACSLCHTDLDEIEGRIHIENLPRILGHQVVGKVAASGKNCSKFKDGDRVGVTWLFESCDNCHFCNKGLENLCKNAKFTGKDADGGYAQYMTVPEDFAYPIPENFTDSQAAPLLCAGVIGYRTFRLADIDPDSTIGLFGFGASAHIVIQVIKHKFPETKVYVFSRGRHHRKLAEKLGADWTGKPSENPPEKLNRAMDFTPVGETVKTALSNLDSGGKLVINAIRKQTKVPELDYEKHLWMEKEIISVANVTKKDARDFLPLAAEIPIKPTVEEFGLENANEVLIKMKKAELKAAAVLKMEQ